MSTLEKVTEACCLRAFMPDNREFVAEMAKIFGCRPLKADGDALYHFLETIYNYGMVQGIRRERRRRRGAVK